MLIVRLLLGVTGPFISLAQGTNETSLLPKAQAAVEKGLSAAKEQQWKIAIRCFDEARQAAPDSPVPLANLGLAEAQVPGRELRAICFFEAYLALVPNAANVPAVRKQITDLDVRAEGNARKMIDLLKGTAAKLSDYHRDRARENVASLLVRIGDLDASQAVLDQSNDDARDGVLSHIIPALTEAGRGVDAIKQADQIKSDTYKSAVYKDIALAQIEAGLLSEAKTSLDILSGIRSPDEYYYILFRLAEAEYQAGQREQAAILLRDAKASIDKIAPSDYYFDSQQKFLIPLAAAEYKTDRREAGEALLHQIKSSLGDLKSLRPRSDSKTPWPHKYGDRSSALVDLAVAFNEIGQRKIAFQCLDEATQARIAGSAAHELVPRGIVDKYIEMQEWDRAKAQAWRDTDDVGWSKKDKTDWVAARMRDIANAKIAIADASAKASSIKSLTDATSSPAQRAQAWCHYMNATMNTPLFTDFKITLEGLANYVPKENPDMDTSMFARVEDQVEVFVNRLKDVRDLQAKQIKLAENGHDNSPPPEK